MHSLLILASAAMVFLSTAAFADTPALQGINTAARKTQIRSAALASGADIWPGLSRTTAEAGGSALAGDAGATQYGFEVYSGWLVDTRGSGYGFLGGGADRKLDEHKALTLKFMASYLYYEYASGATTFEARAPGVKVQAGMKFFGPGTFFAVTGGVEYRDTDLDPDDPGSDVRGGKVGGVFDVHLIKDLTDEVIVDLLGSYSTTGDTLWGRGRYKHLLRAAAGKRLYLGLEGVGEGNNDYSAYRVGGLVELKLIRQNFSAMLASGFRHSSGGGDSAYFGIELYHRYH